MFVWGENEDEWSAMRIIMSTYLEQHNGDVGREQDAQDGEADNPHSGYWEALSCCGHVVMEKKTWFGTRTNL